jgi:hypothetical protein
MPDAADDTRSAVAAVADTLAADLEALAGRWRAGTLDDSDFRLAMAQAIKRGHVAAAAVAAGGKANLTPTDLGSIGNRLKSEYKYLDRFVRGVDDPSAYGNAAARAAMYGQAILATYEDTRRRAMRDGGATRERRVLGTVMHEHCPECLAYAALGWQPIGSLPGVGEACSCKSNCHCHFEHDGAAGAGYDVEAARAAAALPGADLRALLAAAPHDTEREELAAIYLEAGAGAAAAVKLHGMPGPEMMRPVVLGALTLHSPDTPRGRTLAITSLVGLAGGPGLEGLPPALAAHVGDVYLATRANAADAAWAVRYNIPGFRSRATGGDGPIVFYDRPADRDTIAHEAGHVLATARFGSVAPPEGGNFMAAARSGEPPPTDYARVSPVEDFAESVMVYVRDREAFRASHPGRFRAIDRLLTRPS